MYNVDQIRMFVEAVELGSFSASAKKLGKVQSAVSQGIANLEIDFNIQLFDRKTRKPTLTKEGLQLFKQAKAIILQMEDLELSVQSVIREEEPIITLALDDALLMPSLSLILNEFLLHFPSTEIELISVSSTDVASLIVDNRADLGLMFTSLSFIPDIDPCFIGNLPFSLVSHPENILTKSEKIRGVELVAQRQLMVRGDKGNSIEQLPVVAGKIWWSNSFNSIKEIMLHTDLGWAYLPSHLVKNELSNNQLVELDISFDHKPWCPPVDIVTSKTVSKGVALQWLELNLKKLLD